MAWVSPTGFVDPDSAWTAETLAYDDDTGTKARRSAVPINTWSEYLELTIGAISCDKVQFWASYSALEINEIDLDVYYEGGWHDVFQGAYAHRTWVEKSIPAGTKTVTAARARFYNDHDTLAKHADWFEFAFNSLLSAPTVSTQAAADILPTTATGNGNITDDGGENCTKRGVCWNTTGNPTVGDSKSEEIGSFGAGAFTRPMTGLTPGEHYYVKAYAYNSAGYGYGNEVEFTASQLLQPAGIGSAEAFGALTVVPGAVNVLPTAIASLESFGTAKLNLKIAPSAIVSAEAFGTPIVISSLTIYPSAIPSAEAFGSPVIAGPLIVPGIASAEVFGSPTATPGGVSVAPGGISSAELFGLPKLDLFVTPSGIVTSEVFGTAKLNLKLLLTGIASAEAFGTATVKVILVIRPSGLVSVEAFGNPILIVILAGGHGMRLPTTKGQQAIPSGQVSIPSKEVSI